MEPRDLLIISVLVWPYEKIISAWTPPLQLILEPFSSKKSSNRPSVDQFTKKVNLGSNAKNLDPKRKFVTFQFLQVHRYRCSKNI